MPISERSGGSATFRLDVDAGSLVVSGELTVGAEEKFKRACLDLLEGGPKEVLVDLVDVTFVCTGCLGVLFLLDEQARPRNVKVRLRVGEKTAGICKMMGLDKLVLMDVLG